MAGLYAIWKPIGHVNLDGVQYDIAVKQRQDGRFAVAWVCLGCCEQGTLLPGAASFDHAMAFADVAVRAHHALVHAFVNSEPDADEEPTCTPMNHDCGTSPGRNSLRALMSIAFKKLCEGNHKFRPCAATTDHDKIAARLAADDAADDIAEASISNSHDIQRRTRESIRDKPRSQRR
jgi:hypothetical protein